MQNIKIIYEDTDTIILDKPAGVLVHGDGKSEETHSTRGGQETVVDFVLGRYPEIKNVGDEPNLRPGIVHRIDKDTSGVLLVAKTQQAFEFYKNEFKERKVEKVYHAFVYGWPKEKEGKINKPIGRVAGSFGIFGVGNNLRGEERDAETDYKLLGIIPNEKNFPSGSHSQKEYLENLKDNWKGSTDLADASFIEARPKTGRTHQIRVHLKSINHPIICDPLYASKRPSLLGFSRLALHARSLTTTLLSGTTQTFTAEYPRDFVEVLSKVQKLDK